MVARTPLFQDSGGDARQMQAGDSVPLRFGGAGQRLRGTVGVMSGNSQIPFDNTPPLSTEGTLIWTATITPEVLGSNLAIEFAGMLDTSRINANVTIAIFRNTVLIGFVTGGSTGYNGSCPAPFAIKINEPSQGLVAVTYSCRVGVDLNSTTWYLGRGDGATMGGMNSMGYSIIEEI